MGQFRLQFNPETFQSFLLFALLFIATTIHVQSSALTSLKIMSALYGLTLVGFIYLWILERVRPFLLEFSDGLAGVGISLLISAFIHWTQEFSPFLVFFSLMNILFVGVQRGLFWGLIVSFVSVIGFLLNLLFNPTVVGLQLGLISVLNSLTFVVVGFVAGYLHETLFETREELAETRTEKERLEWDLKQKEKLAAIGQLAAGIAHEIRNPLASISGSIEMLSQTTSNPDDQKLMRIVLKEVQRLNHLITDFLDYAKPEKPPTEAINLDQVLQESVQSLEMSLQNMNTLKAPLQFHVSIQRARVRGYPGPLKQAFLNFLINAVQAMKDVEAPWVGIELSLQGDKALVVIEDRGSGMTPEIQQRIFEPFFTTKSKGTGLGLAMTHKILTLHSVQISIESKVGVGTRFLLEFPTVT